MTMTRAQVIIVLSILTILVGFFLLGMKDGGSDGSRNERLGRILIGAGAVVLIVTSMATYKIIRR